VRLSAVVLLVELLIGADASLVVACLLLAAGVGTTTTNINKLIRTSLTVADNRIALVANNGIAVLRSANSVHSANRILTCIFGNTIT